MVLGIMGIGLMGRAFARRFAATGLHVNIYNRHYDKVIDLADEGCTVFESSNDFIASCDTIILMASDSAAIKQLLPLEMPAPDTATEAASRDATRDATEATLQARALTLANKTIIQMATIAPEQSRDLAEKIERCGGRYLEAPVLGSLPEAAAGSLIIMAGGDNTLYHELLPTLKILGNKPRLIGPVGAGSALKLSMNQLIASLTAGFSLSLAYARHNGVDTDLFMDTVRDSALYAKTYDKKLDKYLARDFGTANFSTRHLLKDIRLFIDGAKLSGLDTNALEGIERITSEAVDRGLSSMDYSSIYQVIDPVET